MKGYRKYFGKKLAWFLITLVVAVILNFVLPRLMPADPVSAITGKMAQGMTDASAVQTTRGGKPACCVSVATRYIHSPIETADLNDCLGAVDFVCAMAEEAELPLE